MGLRDWVRQWRAHLAGQTAQARWEPTLAAPEDTEEPEDPDSTARRYVSPADIANLPPVSTRRSRKEWRQADRALLRAAVSRAVEDLTAGKQWLTSPPPRSPVGDPRGALARAYARAGVPVAEVDWWEDRRESGEDLWPGLSALAALRGTPLDQWCALPGAGSRLPVR